MQYVHVRHYVILLDVKDKVGKKGINKEIRNKRLYVNRQNTVYVQVDEGLPNLL
jgi:23S rRNA C2498 (ribose-2'-O)-methylase RlmM